MSSWVIVAILAGLASSLSNFLFRYLLKEGDDSTSYAWFHEVFRLIFFGFICLFNFHLVLDPKGLLFLLGLGLSEFMAAYTYMKMHAYSALSISSLISRTRLIWVPIIAFILFQERLSLLEYFGIIIIFIGLAIVSSPKKIVLDKGMKFAYLSAFIIALVNIFMKLVTPYTNTSTLMVFMAFPSVVLFPLFMQNAKKRLLPSLKINFGLKILTGFITALTIYLLAKAIELGPVSKVAAIYQSMMVSAVIAGIILLKEKEDVAKKLIGCLISLLGVLLLTL